ncbi:MAG: protein-glutamate O-methyltransferase CheR [Alphaproteobacteria bacterium]|jgi:chemotaxis protein methyltransferase CheR|nr:protein-glutamate O-methyltransferase CheR [Alphaproteobacteria bacterium]MDP6516844.1 protein-glutamate O-methyltransferase CheR [Alphaproteobacteria bacterium]|tara:strand:- start:390 stop:998 length:609 start_codon:yes stop_codon:yes gene_type:complete
MTTNETLFFRDIRPFDQLRKVILPHLAEARAANRRIRLWSAACSTGQEPYSFAMIIKDIGELLNGWRVEIFATDLSSEALDKAKVGLYSQFEVQRGLPVTMMTRYFKRTEETWQIDSAIRAMVTFREFNLLEDFSRLGSFDAIYCRNVLIYFDKETKADILRRVRKILPDDGFLSLGGAETVLGVTDAFKPIDNERGLYAPA